MSQRHDQSAYTTGEVSHWMRSLPGKSGAHPALTGSERFDAAIVGGGLTGLWAAYYLIERHPGMRVALLERHHIGYGASGRNGGWLSHLVPGNREIYSRGPRGIDGSIALQRQMVDAVQEVLTQAGRLNIDMDAHVGGNLVASTTPAATQRLQHRKAADHRFGLSVDEVQLLSGEEARSRINAAGTQSALYYPKVARINPAKLVHGLAATLERRGVRIFEGSTVDHVGTRTLSTSGGGRIEADKILLCTEGYSGPLLGSRRVVPINSSVIATNPLPREVWGQIGWEGQECLSDAAHTFIYAQRSADDRIVIGGRGSPYHFRSGTGGAGDIPQATVAQLLGRLRKYFPGIDLSVAHGWSGVLGVTRDWCATVSFNPTTGVGTAHGYAGHGVTATNLFARTLVDLAYQKDSDLVRLPIVDHRSPNWEPEPIRWIGIHAMYRLFRYADHREERATARSTSTVARIGGRLAGLSD